MKLELWDHKTFYYSLYISIKGPTFYINSNLSSDIRYELLNLIDDIEVRKLIESKHGIEFIEELSIQFLHENSNKVDEAILTLREFSSTNSINTEETFLTNPKVRQLSNKLKTIK